jgi:CRP-like cAMP-binding protein
LKKGAITVIVDNQIIGLINTPNTIIGEMSYFLGVKRTASIKAVENSEFMIITGKSFNDAILTNPKVGIELIKILSERLEKTTKYATKLENDITRYRNEIRKINGQKEQKKPVFSEEMIFDAHITKKQLDKSVKELETRKNKGEKVSLAKILIEKNYITAQQLIQLLDMKQQT